MMDIAFDAIRKAVRDEAEQNPKISLDTYKQVTKERDIAIEQLHELGYEFGEKIPTTQECQAESDKLDAAFHDGYNHGYAQARFDYEQEPTTKNDLVVDCISRQAVIDVITANCIWENEYNLTSSRIKKAVENLPSVTPQEPIIDKIRAEIAEYGSIMVTYAITDDTKTDKGIEKLVSDVLQQAKEEVLQIIDKHKAESEEI